MRRRKQIGNVFAVRESEQLRREMVSVEFLPFGKHAVSVREQTSDATLSSRPLFSHRASADMDDSETLDAPVGHGIAECKP